MPPQRALFSHISSPAVTRSSRGRGTTEPTDHSTPRSCGTGRTFSNLAAPVVTTSTPMDTGLLEPIPQVSLSTIPSSDNASLHRVTGQFPSPGYHGLDSPAYDASMVPIPGEGEEDEEDEDSGFDSRILSGLGSPSPEGNPSQTSNATAVPSPSPHTNLPSTTQVPSTDPALLAILQQMTTAMTHLSKPADHGPSANFKSPSINAPDKFDGTNPTKLRPFLQVFELIFANDERVFANERKKVIFTVFYLSGNAS